jgi:hypothetical protein
MISYRNRNRHTLAYLKTMYFDYPEWTLCRVGLMPATWMKYREDLEALVLSHPRIFPGYIKGTKDFDRLDNPLYEPGRHTDCWGTVWENIERGLDSMPVTHPLEDWEAFEGYIPPDPQEDDLFGPRPDDRQVAQAFDAARKRGDLAVGGGLPHGFMFMRLFYLRGFEHLMMDMATEDPRLWRLIRMVEGYNTTVIRAHLTLGAEFMHFGDDLGMQQSLPMSPAMWQRFIKPSYMRMFKGCREADVPIYLHTDGHVLEIIPDLIEAGVRILNPQIRANGLDGLKEIARGRVALDQDLDRQLFPFATPSQIEDHIGTVFEALYLPEGGLMLYAECEPDVPLDNIDAICTVFEKLCRPPES